MGMPSVPEPSFMEDPDLDPETISTLMELEAESLVLLALNIAKRCLDIQSSGGKLIQGYGGSFHVTHVVELETIKLVIRVPCTGWCGGMTPTAKDALDSQVATMRLIRNKTNIPVPEIFAYDTTANNEIGAPYICMSFIPGKRVSEIWFKDPTSGALSREEFRLRILTDMAQTMTQFSSLTFDKIGSIMEDGSGSMVIG
jgi:hypothetical protein